MKRRSMIPLVGVLLGGLLVGGAETLRREASAAPVAPAEVVATDPAGSTAAASLRPLDACTLTTTAVRNAPPGAPVAGLSAERSSLDNTCRLTTRENVKLQVVVGSEFGDEERGRSAQVTIAGVRAFRQEQVRYTSYADGTACTIDVAVGFTRSIGVSAERDVPHGQPEPDRCAVAEELATGVTHAVTATAVQPGTPPVRFLRPDEPYRRRTGPCADAHPAVGCALPADVDAPGSVEDLLESKDASYLCAAGLGPVRRAFGPDMVAATRGDFCVFSHERGEVEVELSANPAFTYADYGHHGVGTVRDHDVAGHSGQLIEMPGHDGSIDRDWYVTPYPDVDGRTDTRRGVIALSTSVRAPRGTAAPWRRTTLRDPALGLRGEQVLADILSEYDG
ncbi:DUF3558 domain-containing protein [Pseudonocardia phyllosphaerae]|uniref:hypothetical protein n=1 Tax=Pseudonocardia phyllosphaerae TaxID=3390502 RepID=UPI003979BE8F